MTVTSGGAPVSNEKPVVAGVDGSPGSRTALELATEEAVRRIARLLVVAARW